MFLVLVSDHAAPGVSAAFLKESIDRLIITGGSLDRIVSVSVSDSRISDKCDRRVHIGSAGGQHEMRMLSGYPSAGVKPSAYSPGNSRRLC